MAATITAKVRAEILRLCRKGWTGSDVAEKCKVSKSTVCRIRRKLKPTKRRTQRRKADPPSVRIDVVGWCPSCHHHVELPCRACAITPREPIPQAVEKSLAKIYHYEPGVPINYDLEPGDELRRQAVRFGHRLSNARQKHLLVEWLDEIS